MMKFMTDTDYVKFYADKLKMNNKYFEQQKILIDSQINASRELFLNRFGKKYFKKNAREYLKFVGLI